MQNNRRKLIWFFSLLFLGFFSLLFLKTGFTISQITENNKSQILPIKKLPKLPEKDSNRINILVLGMRGADDPGEGKFLSDTIILLSFNKITNKASLISLPRDLYVYIWGLWEKKKINSAYAYGGFDSAKKTVSLITNQHIDYAVNANFQSLTELIDVLGGIEVYLDKSFEESFQWALEGKEESEYWVKKEVEEFSTTTLATTTKEKWTFEVPAGKNILDGQTALYYVRSRFSSSDFDRMKRQQKIIIALKNKALSLGVLTNPVKIYNILDLLGKNIKTDMSLNNIKNIINLYNKNINIKTKIFDASEQGLLYEDIIDNEYVLLPIDDNFIEIQKACENIIN